jgi:hypothetical protein
MIVGNEDIREIVIEVPEGHRHLRTTIRLRDGTEFVFQEATVANLVRAFVTVKTHPVLQHLRLEGRPLETVKNGYARWQLLEADE